MPEMCNLTSNLTNLTSDCDDPLLLYRRIVGTIFFIAIWPVIVFDFNKYFPISRPAAALVGGTLMVVFYVIDQSEVYEIIGGVEGNRGNLRTLFLLMGMMFLSFYFDREGLLPYVALRIYGRNRSPFRSVLWKVCLVSGFLSALITNDAACVIITPLLLEEHLKQKRDKKELYFLCLAIATSANIGSAATFFGNPQNAFIASASNVNLLQFLISLLPASIIGLLINIALLYLYYLIHLKYSNRFSGKCCLKHAEKTELESEPTPNDETNNEIHDSGHGGDIGVQDDDQHQPKSLPTIREIMARERNPPNGENRNSIIALERDALFASMALINDTWSRRTSRPRRTHPSQMPHELDATELTKSLPNLSSRPQQSKTYGTIGRPDASFETNRVETESVTINVHPNASITDEDTTVPQEKKKEKKWKKILFFTMISIITFLVVALLIIPPITIKPNDYQLKFDLGLVPFGGAVIIMLIDCIINRRSAYDAMVQIDWTLILLFVGLFVWLEGFQRTGFPRLVFDKLEDYMKIVDFNVPGILLFTAFVLVGSSVISNVPLTILIVDHVCELYKGCDPGTSRVVPAMLLAWVATVAGNFTLIGSIANLLVAEKAKTSKYEYILSFFGYLKFGAVSTLFVTLSGLPIVYWMATLSEKVVA